MAKFTQGKEGEALAYPKTLAEAVFLDENGENIKKDILELSMNGEVLAVALGALKESIESLMGGNILGSHALLSNNVAKNDAEVQALAKAVLGTVYGKFLKDLSDTNEEILGTALCLLLALPALASAVAPAHSGNKAYQVGDLVSHDSRFYECLVAHTGLWDDTKWEQITLIGYIRKYFAPINNA